MDSTDTTSSSNDATAINDALEHPVDGDLTTVTDAQANAPVTNAQANTPVTNVQANAPMPTIGTPLLDMPVLPTGAAATGPGPWYSVTRGTEPGVYEGWYVTLIHYDQSYSWLGGSRSRL